MSFDEGVIELELVSKEQKKSINLEVDRENLLSEITEFLRESLLIKNEQ